MNQLTKLATAVALGAAIMLPGAAFATSDLKKVEDGSRVEVAITSAGNVLVRGAKVTAISDTAVTATTNWGGTTLTWSVFTDSSTEYLDKGANTLTRATIAVGDTVSFAGPFQAGSSLTVKATALKDWSRGETPAPQNDDQKHWKNSIKVWFKNHGIFGFRLGH